MSHDFAKSKNGKKKPPKQSSKKQESPQAPRWLFFVAGVLTTVFAQFIYHLALVDTDIKEDIVEPAKESLEEVVEKPTEVVFDFYEKLKEDEVKVSDEVVEQREQEDYNYALQAGSFKSKTDANQQRAEIMLLGLNAKIEARKSESGTLWHRVIVGPFTSRSDLHKARSILIQNEMPTMKIKRS